MIVFGSGVNIAGAFVGTKRITGYYQYGNEGQLVSSGIFDNLGSIDPPPTTTPAPPALTPSAPTNISIVTVDS